MMQPPFALAYCIYRHSAKYVLLEFLICLKFHEAPLWRLKHKGLCEESNMH